MHLFDGLSKTDYQDVLRTLGWFIDEHGLVDIRILEVEEGIILQGRPRNQSKFQEPPLFETYLITDEDLKEMVREAYRRRGQKVPEHFRGTPQGEKAEE